MRSRPAFVALLNEGRVDAAIETFKLNAEACPKSWNVYDSLAEAYMKKGEKALAISNYEKSLALNPENHSGRNFLTRLKQQ